MYRYLQQTEKEIDNQIYKARLNIQEKLIKPSQKVKALLRTHIYSYITKEQTSENETSLLFKLRLQGKVLPILDSQVGGFYHRFTYYFQKIKIVFENKQYDNIEWKNNSTQLKDGIEITRKLNEEQPINLIIYLYLNYPCLEYKLKDELSELLGIKQETRPYILYHMWQYIKINSLQDNDNPNYIITNEPLQKIFKVPKIEISKLTSYLVDHIQEPDPITIPFTINLNENYLDNQILQDIIITIEDPHFKDIFNLLSHNEKESLLFPMHIGNRNKNESVVDNYFYKMGEYDKRMDTLIEMMKKHKYQHDFYEAYIKDPIKFINNFIIQQNTLVKMLDVSNFPDFKMEIYSPEYEEAFRDFIDNELANQNYSIQHHIAHNNSNINRMNANMINNTNNVNTQQGGSNFK